MGALNLTLVRVILCHSTTCAWRVDGVYVFSLEVTVINLSVHQDSYVNVHATRPPTTAIVVDASPSPSQSTVYDTIPCV